MAKMRVIQVAHKGGSFELVERDLPEPGPGEVRVKVQAFSALSGVRPVIETMPLERAAEAYDKMMRGDARFRMVLLTGQ